MAASRDAGAMMEAADRLTPLALAVLAARWRIADYGVEHYWHDIVHKLDEGQELPVSAAFSSTVGAFLSDLNARHLNSIRAVAFPIDALEAPDRERLTDLALSPRQRRTLPSELFRYFWARVPRAGARLGAADPDPVAVTLAGFALVKPEGDGHALHDLVRIAIQLQPEGGPTAFAARHRALLATCGLMDPGGRLTLDATRDFRRAPDPPDAPGAGRVALHLRLLPDHAGPATAAEREALSTYFLDHLLHHVRHAAPDALHTDGDTLAHQLLACLPYLQAQLDHAE